MQIDLPGYKVENLLGQGGMAAVYRAKQLRLDRDVAIKILNPAYTSDKNYCERFLREARIAAKLAHSNIVQIFDADVYEDNYYLTMELVPGGELHAHMRRGLTANEIIGVLEPLCSALDHAHKQGYIHRDIKPTNILFRQDGTPVITDFGIARPMQSETGLTLTGTMVGTPKYMSPEQALAKDLDAKSDLYSLAVITYEMFTGVPPYLSDSSVSVAIKHINDPIPQLPRGFEPLQAFFNQALAKDPAQRFENGKFFIGALKKAVQKLDETQALSVDTKAITVLSNSSDETIKSTAIEGEYISKITRPVTQALRKILEITGISTSPQRKGIVKGFVFAASIVLIVFAAGTLKNNFSEQPGPQSESQSQSQSQPEADNTIVSAESDIPEEVIQPPVKEPEPKIVKASAPPPPPADAGLDEKTKRTIAAYLDKADRYLERDSATRADKIYLRIERLAPKHPALKPLGVRIADSYVVLAQREIDKKDWEDVDVWVARGLKHVPNHQKLKQMSTYAREQINLKARR